MLTEATFISLITSQKSTLNYGNPDPEDADLTVAECIMRAQFEREQAAEVRVIDPSLSGIANAFDEVAEHYESLAAAKKKAGFR